MNNAPSPKKAYIIYHSADLDGKLSAQIALNYLLTEYTEDRITMLPHDYHYDQDQLLQKIEKGSLVIMLDISLTADAMYFLEVHCGEFIWIDHHKTAIEQNPESYLGIRQVGVAACELAYEYFFGSELIGDYPISTPLGVKLAGQYDVWNKDGDNYWESEVLPFQWFWRFRDIHPEPNGVIDKRIIKASESDITDQIIGGGLILNYKKRECKEIAELYAHTLAIPVWDGDRETLWHGVAINSSVAGSMALESVFDEDEHYFMCVYHFTGKVWKFSLYHPNAEDLYVDLGKQIAQKFGGGGHAGACGFTLDVLPDWIDESVECAPSV